MLRYVVRHPVGVLLPAVAASPDEDVIGVADLAEEDLEAWLDFVAAEVAELVSRN